MKRRDRLEAGLGSRYAVLALLSLIYLIHSIDRQIVSIILEPIKHEFNISDKMLGLVGGLGYSVAFAIACLPMGWVVDRVNRVRLLTVLLAAWSGLTALCGFASGFWLLFLARMGTGAAEAGGAPTIMSLISDYFTPRDRSAAIGICYMSAALGIAASFFVGALVAASFGWRAAFWIAGIPGLLVAVAIPFLIQEPERGASESAGTRQHGRAPTMKDALKYIFQHKGLAHLAVAIPLASFVLSTIWIWIGSLLIRYHDLSLAQVGPLVAIAALFQGVGSWLGGIIARRVSGSSIANLGTVAAAAVLLVIPLGITVALASSTIVAVVALCVMAICNGMWTGPSFGLSMTLTVPHVRGVVSSFIQLFSSLVGFGAGPFVTGVLSDALPGGLRSAFAVIFTVNIWAAAHYLLAVRAVRKLEPFSQNP